MESGMEAAWRDAQLPRLGTRWRAVAPALPSPAVGPRVCEPHPLCFVQSPLICEHVPETPSGCLKPWGVLSLTQAVFSLYRYACDKV